MLSHRVDSGSADIDRGPVLAVRIAPVIQGYRWELSAGNQHLDIGELIPGDRDQQRHDLGQRHTGGSVTVELADRQRHHVLRPRLSASQSDRAELGIGAELEDIDPEAHVGSREGERLVRQAAFPRYVERFGAVRRHGKYVVQMIL